MGPTRLATRPLRDRCGRQRSSWPRPVTPRPQCPPLPFALCALMNQNFILAFFSIAALAGCWRTPPAERARCAPDRGSYCAEGGLCIDGRCYQTCEGRPCATGEECFVQRLAIRCFADTAGERRLCATAAEMIAVGREIGGEWRNGSGVLIASEAAREKRWLEAARGCALDAGCRDLCFSNDQCSSHKCNCGDVFIVDGGIATGQCEGL